MIRKTQKIGASIKRSFLKAQKFKMISDQTKSKEFEKLKISRQVTRKVINFTRRVEITRRTFKLKGSLNNPKDFR